MAVVENVFLLLGAITVFLFGLKTMSEEAGKLSGEKLKKTVRAVATNKFGAVLAGCLSTAVLQSSIATNIVVISFVEKGILSFVEAAAVVMGTNIGTTMTAQLVSFSAVGDFDISAIGSLIAFVGFLLTLGDNDKRRAVGGTLLGFGLIFIGLELMTSAVDYFKGFMWFRSLFLVKNPLILFLNGLFITAIIQSSSVATSMMIILGSLDLLAFGDSMFLILGANVGTCLAVIAASYKMSDDAKKTALFNLAFNVFGCIVFFPVLALSGDFVSSLLAFSGDAIGRKIANFHTLFNVAVCLIILPFLKQFCIVTEKIYCFLYSSDKRKSKRKSKQKRADAKTKTASFTA